MGLIKESQFRSIRVFIDILKMIKLWSQTAYIRAYHFWNPPKARTYINIFMRSS